MRRSRIPATVLSTCYAKSGTDLRHAATRSEHIEDRGDADVVVKVGWLSSYASDTRCPAMVLPGGVQAGVDAREYFRAFEVACYALAMRCPGLGYVRCPVLRYTCYAMSGTEIRAIFGTESGTEIGATAMLTLSYRYAKSGTEMRNGARRRYGMS
eukprot:309858-Rhodomonas_salina.1